MKKCFCLVLTLAMFISLLAGCSQTKSTTSDSGTAIPNTTTDPASAASSSEKDTLIIAVNEDISGLDPFAQNTSLQNTYTILNYDCLLSLNPQTGAVEKNGLATDYDIISPTEYVFHLREGVKFHEGQTLKARENCLRECQWLPSLQRDRPNKTSFDEYRDPLSYCLNI